ncbi:MAG TPA: GNAT family N-acetyltransferase [Rhodospirillaceae bacterium]|nr:GNAT family N-acetyltransferase [Rhodospirillaceae bacterium]
MIKFRLLRQDDVADLARVLESMEPFSQHGFTAAGLTSYLSKKDPSLFRYVIKTKGRMAGVLAWRSPWLRGSLIELLAVYPEAQGLGLGSKALAWLIDKEKAKSKNLWVTVSDFNAAAKRFYLRHGFVETAALPDLVSRGISESLLRRALDYPAGAKG